VDRTALLAFKSKNDNDNDNDSDSDSDSDNDNDNDNDSDSDSDNDNDNDNDNNIHSMGKIVQVQFSLYIKSGCTLQYKLAFSLRWN